MNSNRKPVPISLEQEAINNGWVREGIGFLVHPDAEFGVFLDFNGGDGDCYYVMKANCSEVYDICFSYTELEKKYIRRNSK